MILNKYLPIGTVIKLKNGSKRIMITGFCCKIDSNPNQVYDYTGCLYPEGYISNDDILLFNHDQIENIYHLGLIDGEQIELNKKLIEAFK